MPVIQLPPTALRVGHPVPFALRDASGHLLVPRGGVVDTEVLRQQLIARGIYVDEIDSGLFKKALAGKLDSMLRQNALLGQIAQAQPEVADVPASPGLVSKKPSDPIAASASPVLAPLGSKSAPDDQVDPSSRDSQNVGGAPVFALAASARTRPPDPAAMPGSAYENGP